MLLTGCFFELKIISSNNLILKPRFMASLKYSQNIKEDGYAQIKFKGRKGYLEIVDGKPVESFENRGNETIICGIL